MQVPQASAESRVTDHTLQPDTAMMQHLLEAMPTAIAMVDRNLRYLVTSRQWQLDFHLGHSSLVGQSLHAEIVQSHTQLSTAIAGCLTTATPCELADSHFPGSDAAVFTWQLTPWFVGPSVQGVILSVQPQPQLPSGNMPPNSIQDWMEESRQRLERIIQQMPIAVIEWDPNLQIVEWNPAAEALFGYSRAEAIGQAISLVTPDEYEPALRQITAALILNSAQCQNFTHNINQNLTKDGRLLTCEWHNTRLINADGELIGIASMAVDVSDRKRTEAQLQHQEQFLRSIYDGVDCSIFVIDVTPEKDFLYNSYNNVAERWTGRTTAQIAGHTPEELFGETEGQAVRAAFLRCVDSGAPLTEEEHLTFGDREVWLMSTFNPMWDASGRLHRIVGTAFDITRLKQTQVELENTLQELKQTQAQLVQNEKMSSLGQLVAGVAHEINNPVNFIYGNLNHANSYIEELLELIDLYHLHYPEPVLAIQQKAKDMDVEFLIEDLPKLLNSMKVGADRIQKIIASLRTFSRMDEAEMKAVNIHDGIDSTLMILQSRIKATDQRPTITVQYEYGELPLVECYAGQLNQVFMNILSNAIDALEDVVAAERITFPASGFVPIITIRTQKLEQDWVEIAIADNGFGIPENIQTRLFDPFFTTKPVGKGTGMGLSISYQIVTEKHGGRLCCQSTPGVGTEFQIQIPLRQVTTPDKYR
jgi:PAS domain S-box-containing protein